MDLGVPRHTPAGTKGPMESVMAWISDVKSRIIVPIMWHINVAIRQKASKSSFVSL